MDVSISTNTLLLLKSRSVSNTVGMRHQSRAYASLTMTNTSSHLAVRIEPFLFGRQIWQVRLAVVAFKVEPRERRQLLLKITRKMRLRMNFWLLLCKKRNASMEVKKSVRPSVAMHAVTVLKMKISLPKKT